nr:PREDICTED: putative deoxyribonuclease tatdn3 isoform X2 [Paralichthys olivaceus]
MDLGFVDAHCHISAREFEEDLGDVIQRSRRAGVETLIAVTEEVGEFSRVLQLQQRYPDVVAPCFGLHPLQGGEGPEPRCAKPQDLDAALPLFYKHREHLVAVGEIGLDFTPWRAPTQQDRDDQMTVFVKQLDVAKELDLPVHQSRSASQLRGEAVGGSGRCEGRLPLLLPTCCLQKPTERQTDQSDPTGAHLSGDGLSRPGARQAREERALQHRPVLPVHR